jgi:formate-dependent nitrite reductase cytochrome c552 subunit
MPQQPIPFDHSLHSGQLGMDCRYCHTHVENSLHSNIPAAQVCWNCHGTGKVKSDSPKLEPLRQAMDENYENYTGEPIKWVQIHKTPDYAYFNHSVHVNRGVSCVECHGRVDEMAVVYHAEPLSMSWCLDCHRNPAENLRPLDQITNLDWVAEDLDKDQFYAELAGKTGAKAEELKAADEGKEWSRELIGAHLKEAWQIHPPQDCSACHR